MNNFKLAKQDNVVQGSHSEVGLPVRIAYKNWLGTPMTPPAVTSRENALLDRVVLNFTDDTYTYLFT